MSVAALKDDPIYNFTQGLMRKMPYPIFLCYEYRPAVLVVRYDTESQSGDALAE